MEKEKSISVFMKYINHSINKNLYEDDFNDLCVNVKDKFKDVSMFFEEYRTLFIELMSVIYQSDIQKKQTGLINSTIAGLMKELTELLDSMYILSNKNSNKAIFCLVRKFFEVYVQLIYILQENSYEKSLVYNIKSALLIEEVSKRNEELSSIKKHIKNDILVNKYKKDMEKDKYKNWYYYYSKNNGNILISSFSKLCYQINTPFSEDKKVVKTIYNKIYGPLSSDAHGFISDRNVVCINGKNKFLKYRNPYGISYCMGLLNLCIPHICDSIIIFYKLILKEEIIEEFLKKQKKITEQITRIEGVLSIEDMVRV